MAGSMPLERIASTAAVLLLRAAAACWSLGLAKMLGRSTKCPVKSLPWLRRVPSGHLGLAFPCAGANFKAALLTVTASRWLLPQCLQVEGAAAIIEL